MQGEWYEVEWANRRDFDADIGSDAWQHRAATWAFSRFEYKRLHHAQKQVAKLRTKDCFDRCTFRIIHVTPRGREVVDG